MNKTFSPSCAILFASHAFFLVMLDKLTKKRSVLYNSRFKENKTIGCVFTSFPVYDLCRNNGITLHRNSVLHCLADRVSRTLNSLSVISHSTLKNCQFTGSENTLYQAFVVKTRPEAWNFSRQHIATMLHSTCCKRWATTSRSCKCLETEEYG